MRNEPSNRWPWIAIAAGVVVVVLAVVIFYANRRTNQVTISVGTPSVVAAASSPSPPPTLVPPTLPASASLVPTSTPLPATPSPVPTQAPTPSPLPPSPPVVAAPPPAGQPTAPGARPGAVSQASPVATAGTPVPAQPVPAVTATPTPFAGQVSAGGGLGNTRADIDAAYGSPLGQTSNGMVVFRKNNFEYHIGLVPDLNGRASLIVEQPTQTGQLPTLQQAQAEAHRLLPTDAHPPNPAPEGNNQFVVERYTSQNLGQALPANLFSPGGGQPGNFLIVYVKDQQTGNISRWILGPGDDPNALISQAG